MSAPGAGDAPILVPGMLGRYTHGDLEFEQEVMELFLDTARDLVERIAAPGTPLRAVREAVHTLKGNAHTIGAARLGRACEELEAQVAVDPGALADCRARILETWRELLAHLGRPAPELD